MRRYRGTRWLLAGALVALACVSDHNPLPTQPLAQTTGSLTCDATRITALITALFPAGTARNGALAKFSSIQTKMQQGKVADARAKMFELLTKTLADLAAGKLLNTSSSLGLTTQQAVSELFRRLYTCVGLADSAPGDDITAALSSGGAAAVVAPGDAPRNVITGDGLAGAHLETDAFSATQTVLFAITPNPTCTPFPNTLGLQEFPPCYTYETWPDLPIFNKDVGVGICTNIEGLSSEQAGRLQLAHGRRPDRTELELLPRFDADFLGCTSYFPPIGSKGFLDRLAARALALFRPQHLHAATTLMPGGLGGLTDNYQVFQAVDPGTGADLVISAPETLTVTPISVAAGGTVTLSAWTVTNQGTASSNFISNGFYLSTDPTITAVDVRLDGNVNSAGLAAGASFAWGGPTLTIPAGTAPGSYFIGILVDELNGTPESDEGNNFKSTALTVTTPLRFTSITSGTSHTCGLTSTGVAYCWGDNAAGQLGDGTATDRTTPTAVAGALSFATLSAGGVHSCGVTTTSITYCWGGNRDGQLGDGTTTDRLTPTPVVGGATFATVVVGGIHSCGFTSGGAAYCWGSGAYGQLGNGGNASSATPVPVSGDLTFRALAASERHTCGITTSGTFCWGENPYGQLGDGTTTSRTTPGEVGPNPGFYTVAASLHSCALTPDDFAFCWGFNAYGEIGDGTTTNHSLPTAVIGGLQWATISTGGTHTCAIEKDDAIGITFVAYCWGNNTHGQLGDGTTANRATPTQIPSLAFRMISAGFAHSCGLDTGGVAYCWGDNSSGQLGDGTLTSRTAPTRVTGF